MGQGCRTKRKLEEAGFFLEQLSSNYGKLKKFDFYLSAFISSARSVLWVMRSEYEKVSGWESWYKSREPTEEEAALLRGTNNVRVRTEKVKPLETATTYTIRGIRLSDKDLKKLTTLIANATTANVMVKLSGTTATPVLEVKLDGYIIKCPGTEVLIDRKLEEFPDADILGVCRKYYQAITSVVEECSQKFEV